jgi:outer membrane protein assembly factor BamA
MHSYRAFWLLFFGLLSGIYVTFATPRRVTAQQPQSQQRLVENVDIIGNRRLRKDDILYYIQTRPGDVYDVNMVQRDYQTLLSLAFFDKTATRVFTENGARGGVNVIFEVKELPT